MNKKKRFYQVHFHREFFEALYAEDDLKALAMAKRLYPQAHFIVLNEGGYGPRIYLKPISKEIP